MKKLILLPLIFIFTDLQAQSLNSNASYIQENHSYEYRRTIRHHAVEKWGNDHDMIVYEINKQSDALFSLVRKFESDNTQIVFRAISKWSHDGHERRNQARLENVETFDVESIINLHCDWGMVEYEYDKQVNAKGAY